MHNQEKRTMKRNQEGFTLIELVMVIVILGILAAVAIPKFANLTTQAHQSAEDGVIGGLRSGVYTYSVNQMALGNGQVYPGNPFNGLDQTPTGYDSTAPTPAGNDTWGFNSTNNYVYHQRSDGSKYYWSYSSSTGTIGTRATTP